MRLGGYVLFRNNAATLRRALESLLWVCEPVVAVDTGSTDGSADLARSLGAQVLNTPWRGYGDARAVAAAALRDCSYLFFLDSDEWLEAPSRSALRDWAQSGPTRPSFRVRLHDWVDLAGRRFVYRVGTRHRLIRTDCARWRPEMIVHETLELPPAPVLPVTVEHAFITDENRRTWKDDRYAFLWALQAYCRGARPKAALVEHGALTFRDLFLRRALCRGGLLAARIAWLVNAYHAQKHRYLRALRRGEFSSAVDAYASGDLAGLFEGLTSR